MTDKHNVSKNRVQGVIDSRVLERAPQFFNQSLHTIISELLQNSRRAGATRVDITTEACDAGISISFTDDGEGVHDFRALVTFGRSAWDDRAPAENYAGMGVFVLARFGCVIDSQGKQVVLTPNVFVGKDSATIEHAPFRHGTNISFILPYSDSPHTGRRQSSRLFLQLHEAISDETLYCPIEVCLDGHQMPRVPFLEHARHKFVHNGVHIGIYDTQALSKRNCTLFQSMVSDKESVHQEAAFNINFSGHTIKAQKISVPHGVDEIVALFEVRDGASLRLQIPTRDRVIQDEAWSDLQEAALRSIYSTIASQPSHRLSVYHVTIARKLGIDIPDPTVALVDLRTYTLDRIENVLRLHDEQAEIARYAAHTVRGADLNDCIVACDLTQTAFLALRAAAIRNPSAPRFVLSNPDFEGISAYDRLPRIIGGEVIIVMPDGSRLVSKIDPPEFEIGQCHVVYPPINDDALDESGLDQDNDTDYPEEPDTLEDLLWEITDTDSLLPYEGQPLSITLALDVRGPDGSTRIGPYAIPFLAFLIEESDWQDGVSVLLTRGTSEADRNFIGAELSSDLYDADFEADRADMESDPDSVVTPAMMLAAMNEAIERSDLNSGNLEHSPLFPVCFKIADVVGIGRQNGMQSVRIKLTKTDPDGAMHLKLFIKDEDGKSASRSLVIQPGEAQP